MPPRVGIANRADGFGVLVYFRYAASIQPVWPLTTTCTKPPPDSPVRSTCVLAGIVASMLSAVAGPLRRAVSANVVAVATGAVSAGAALDAPVLPAVQ